MRTVGIDLGTSTSEIAYVKDGVPVLIPNEDGEVVTPSVVHIKEDGEVIVGDAAAQLLLTRPECTFIEVKRLFGSDTKLIAHGKEYSPEQIQSYIIKYLVDCAKNHLNENITSAIITVPAYFTDIQRRQTIKAGELAGLKVERVINEPTTAALDYGLSNLEQCENILVYDFGGGTLDVTVLELFEGVIDVKSSCGNNHLGGKDLDEVLMKYIAGTNYSAIMDDPRAAMRLKQAAIDCKIALGVSETHQVRLPFLLAEISIDITVTRDEFEAQIEGLVKSTWTQLDGALADADLQSMDLQKVLLVGGSSRIPLIRKSVASCLGVIPSMVDFPDLTVARGAAIQAAIMDGLIADERTLVLTDVCPFTLGAKVITQNGFAVDPLIKRNTTVPFEFSKVYSAMHEYQEAVNIEVYQGESSVSYENTQLGTVRLSGLPKRQGYIAEVSVTFAYDINGILQVTAESLGNKKKNSITIDVSANDFKQPVKLSEWESAPNAKKYRPLIRKVLKILDDFIGSSEFITTSLYEILDHVNGLKAALINGEQKTAEKLSAELKDFLDDWNTTDRYVSRLSKLFDGFSGYDEDDD